MENENLDDLKSNLNNNHDSLTGKENHGNHFVVEPPIIESSLVTNAVHQSQNQGQNVNLDIYNNQQNTINQNLRKKISLDKKTLIKIGSITAAVGIVVLAVWLGFRWYQRSTDEKILLTAAKNLLETKDLHSKASINFEGAGLNFDIYVDKDQDVKGTISVPDMGEGEVLWFPNKDKAFIGVNFSLFGGEKDKIEYTELTNIKKTIEKYENEFALTDLLNPTKDFFSGENMKYVKREGVDNINNKKLYRYSFKPTKEFIEEKLNKATKDKELSFTLNKSEIEIIFWIENSNLKINKIEGKIKITVEPSESTKKEQEKRKQECLNNYKEKSSSFYDNPEEACKYYDIDNQKEEFKVDWDQEFSYDFKDDIKEPEKEDITESIDIYKELDQGYQNDKTKISDIKEIQEALKDYHDDQGYYPKELTQLEKENKKQEQTRFRPLDYEQDYEAYYNFNNPYLYSLPESPDDNKYEYETKGDNIQSYTLKVKLAAPEYYEKSDYIKDGYLYLTEKSSSSFTLKETGKQGDSTSEIKARDARRKSDLKLIYTALINYSDDNNGLYPTSLSLLITDYLSELPTDPITGEEYDYAISNNKTEIELNAILENSKDNDDDNDGGNDSNVYEIGDDPGLNLI
jgi:hypothetical protein